MSEGFSFSEALDLLKVGRKVARAGWNGKGMWLFVVPAEDWAGKDYLGRGTLPFIAMKTAQGNFVPWLASQTDLLAEDWFVVQG